MYNFTTYLDTRVNFVDILSSRALTGCEGKRNFVFWHGEGGAAVLRSKPNMGKRGAKQSSVGQHAATKAKTTRG